MKIKKITKRPKKEKVYCLNVPSDHEIILSNGVVVGNCLYGATGYGLAMNLGIEPDEGEAILEGFRQTYSEVSQFMDNQFEYGKKYGYVTTMLGRKRRLPQLTYIGRQSYNNYASSFKLNNLKNSTFNSPIQGTSGQTTFAAMTNIWKDMKKNNLRSKVIINVHDEVVLLVHKDEAEEVSNIVHKWFLYEYYEPKNSVRLKAELDLGEVWKEGKPWTYYEKHPDEWNSLIERVNKRNEESELFIKEKLDGLS